MYHAEKIHNNWDKKEPQGDPLVGGCSSQEGVEIVERMFYNDSKYTNLQQRRMPCPYIVVDYISTCKDTEITLDADWHIGYKHQMETNGCLGKMDLKFQTYCNGNTDKEPFDGRLEFDVK